MNHRVQVLRYSDGSHLRFEPSAALAVATVSSFKYPCSVEVDGSGNVFVHDKDVVTTTVFN
jgi:hypothetical protein